MHRTVKRAGCFVAAALALPFIVVYVVTSRTLGGNRAFPGFSQLMSIFPGLTGQYLRRAFYRFVLPQCGRDACICFGSVFSHATARVGERVYVGLYCVLGDVTLEDDCLLGSNVSVINGSRQHGIDRLDAPVREQPGEYPRVTIGRDAWIGDRALVMADVGEHAVVGGGSVVTKPVAPYAIVAGNPARVIGSRRDGATSVVSVANGDKRTPAEGVA